MELDEMKASWEVLTEKVEKQEKLTNLIIEQMMVQKYKSRLNKIAYPEYAGTIMSYLGAVYLIINFNKLDELYTQVLAGICIVLLFIFPVLSLRLLWRMSSLNISTQSYSDAIKTYARQKRQFQRVQQLSVLYGLFLMLACLPVSMDILGKELNILSGYWLLIFPVCIILFLGFALWVFRHYNKSLNIAEAVISETER